MNRAIKKFLMFFLAENNKMHFRPARDGIWVENNHRHFRPARDGMWVEFNQSYPIQLKHLAIKTKPLTIQIKFVAVQLTSCGR